MAGLIGSPVEILNVGGEIKEAVIKFYYDPDKLNINPENLCLVWYDEKNDILTLLSDDTKLDAADNNVYVVTNHFSKYGVVDRAKWIEIWSTKLPAVRTEDVHYNIIFVLDCSGSMYGEKMTNSIKSAQNLVEILRDDDRVTIISFSNYANVVLGTTEIKSSPQDTRNTVKSSLAALTANGSTNMSDALRMAAQYKTDDEHFYSFIILLSDGYADAPVSDSLLNALNNNGQRVLAVGIGDYVDSVLLDRIAASTNGSSLYAEEASQIQDKFTSIINDEFGSDVDTDGDGLPDEAEKRGMRDQYGENYITTDPLKADTDGDGMSDYEEMGEYVKGRYNMGSDSYFKRVSDPRIKTVKSDLAMLSLSRGGLQQVFNDVSKKQFTIYAVITEKKFESDGKKECVYSPVSNLNESNISVKFTDEGNYKLEELQVRKESLGLPPGIKDRKEYTYSISARVSYREKPGPFDGIVWRVTADNLAKKDSFGEERTNYIELVQFIVLPKSDVAQDSELVRKVEARLAELRKNFVEKFCGDAKNGSSNADKDSELAERRKQFEKQLQTYGVSITPEVSEAFCLAVLEAWDNGGSKTEKYKSKPEELYQQLLKDIATSVKNINKEVIVKGDIYRLEITLMHSQGAGVDCAYVYKNGSAYATMTFTTSDELKEVLASYCAKLAELNKDLWNDFLVSYVEDMLDEMEIEVKEGTVEKIFELTELLIRAVCGDKGAGNKIAEKLQTEAKKKITSGFWGLLEKSKFMKFVKDKFPNGQNIVNAAEKLETMKSKYETFKAKMGSYNFWGGDGAEYDAQKAFEDVKTAYSELQNLNLLDGFKSLTEWPEGW